MKNTDEHEMFVFRVPNQLAEQATQKAEEMMISRSAVCRQALSQYLIDQKEYPSY